MLRVRGAFGGLGVAVGEGFSLTVTPCWKRTVRPGMAGMRSPGTRMPARFKGSAAETVMGGSAARAACRLRAVRRLSTASGRAYCSPKGPETKRPPRISPRASRRRRMGRRSRHLGALASRARSSRKRTP